MAARQAWTLSRRPLHPPCPKGQSLMKMALSLCSGGAEGRVLRAPDLGLSLRFYAALVKQGVGW